MMSLAVEWPLKYDDKYQYVTWFTNLGQNLITRSIWPFLGILLKASSKQVKNSWITCRSSSWKYGASSMCYQVGQFYWSNWQFLSYISTISWVELCKNDWTTFKAHKQLVLRISSFCTNVIFWVFFVHMIFQCLTHTWLWDDTEQFSVVIEVRHSTTELRYSKTHMYSMI